MAAAVSGASQRGAARAARPAPRRTGQRRGPSSGGHRPAAAPPPRPPRPPPPPGLQTQLPLLGYGRCGNAGQGVQIPRASVPSAGPFRRPSAPPGRDRCLRFSGRALGSQSSSSSGRLSSAGSRILVRRRRPRGGCPGDFFRLLDAAPRGTYLGFASACSQRTGSRLQLCGPQ